MVIALFISWLLTVSLLSQLYRNRSSRYVALRVKLLNHEVCDGVHNHSKGGSRYNKAN